MAAGRSSAAITFSTRTIVGPFEHAEICDRASNGPDGEKGAEARPCPPLSDSKISSRALVIAAGRRPAAGRARASGQPRART